MVFSFAFSLLALATAQADPLAPLAAPEPSPMLVPIPMTRTPSTTTTTRIPDPILLPPAPSARRSPPTRIAPNILPAPLSLPPTTSATLPPPMIVPRDWPGVFAAIRARDWSGAAAGIATLPNDPLKPVAMAEYYTAKGSPTVPVEDLETLIAAAPELPQAEQMERMAASRGILRANATPERPIIGLGSGPRRGRAKAVVGDPIADALRPQLDPLLKVDQADAAEALMLPSAPFMTPEARAEAAQRIAWSYYGLGRDADAIRVAETGRIGAVGEWAAAASWVSGLASWRQNDCASAGLRFREVAASAREPEFIAAASYWAARAAQACRQPEAVAPLLKAAARSPESFYGLVARETLGMATRLSVPAPADTSMIESLPNVRRAIALAAIGERGLAEESLRHQARIGRPSDQRALIAMAQRLDLAGVQYWLATNGQPGTTVEPAARYPRPRWTPQGGWRVDPALAFGHVIQESNFRAGAVSQMGAVGLMQVRPGTAGDTARARGAAFDVVSLTDPTVNLDYGQAFIELLRSNSATRGQLPRIIAAYNAGPLPVDRWNAIPDKGDPLLWMESIPYWETRYYVPAVMRNMWVYQGLEGKEQPSLKALAEHKWPAFPTR